MNQYTKTVMISFKADKESLKKLNEEIERTSKTLKLSGLDKSISKDQLIRVRKREKLADVLQSNVDTLKKLPFTKENMKALKAIQKDLNLLVLKDKVKSTGFRQELGATVLTKVAGEIKKKFLEVAQAVGNFFKDAFTDAIEEIKTISSYNLLTSKTYSSEAWSMLKEYGVTGSDAYTLSKAMEDIGVNSYEQLTEALLQPKVANYFGERIGYWNENYSDAMEAGKAMQDFTLEWKNFKNDLMMDFVKWFAENKQSIKATLELTANILKSIATMVATIVGVFAKNSNSVIPTASDIVGQYQSVSTTNNNNSVNINVNGTDSRQIGQNVYSLLQTKLGIK